MIGSCFSAWGCLFNVFISDLAQEEVLAPPPDNEDIINDFDIEEDVIEVENRY